MRKLLFISAATAAVAVVASLTAMPLPRAIAASAPAPAIPASAPVISASAPAAPASASAPAGQATDNMSFWLGQAQPAATQPAGSPATTSAPSALQRVSPAEALEDAAAPGASRQGPATQPASREDALPGVIELSDGKQLPGWLCTTRDKDWEVWIEAENRWRRIPFVNLLSIAAVVAEEEMVQEWRWKETGVPERVYTGREYPTRRFLWKFRLIDGSEITGAVKGQPVWAELDGKKSGPFILAERSKGEMGQKLTDLVYIKRIVISRKMLDAAIQEKAASRPASAVAP